MLNMGVSEMKPLIGSRDFAESRDFYSALGWNVNWDDGDLAELELGSCRFFLQKYYQKQWCENSMLHLTVENADAWYQHVKAILEARSY